MTYVKVWPEAAAYDTFQRSFPTLADPWPFGSNDRPESKFLPLEAVDVKALLDAGFDIELTQHLVPDTRPVLAERWVLLKLIRQMG